jgi:ABC-type sugar transport system permease subunit
MFPILLPRVSVGLIWRFFYAPTIGLVNYPLLILTIVVFTILWRTARRLAE